MTEPCSELSLHEVRAQRPSDEKQVRNVEAAVSSRPAASSFLNHFHHSVCFFRMISDVLDLFLQPSKLSS